MKLGLYLNSATSIETGGNLLDWKPVDPTVVWLWVYLDIKAKNSGDFYEFRVNVATPRGLLESEEACEDSLIGDRHFLLYYRVDWPALHDDLNQIISNCDSSSWEESIVLLQRYFEWEYDGFEMIDSLGPDKPV